MGKASKQVIEALNDIYKEENNEMILDEPEDNSDEAEAEFLEEKIEEVSMLIKSALIAYSRDKGVHLCEFLNLENVENYIFHLLQKYPL